MATTAKSKFATTLARDNKQIRADRAIRISEGVADAQTRLVMDIRGQVRTKEDELAAMTDLSTDNTNTTLNVISPNFNANDFVAKINTLKTEIKMLNIKLEIAEETTQEWFS
jgi:hypothetical protein